MKRSLVAALFVCLAAASALAALPTFWQVSTEAEFLQGEVIEREQFGRWFALTGAHIQQFSHVETTTQAFKIFVEGSKGLYDINAIETVERQEHGHGT